MNHHSTVLLPTTSRILAIFIALIATGCSFAEDDANTIPPGSVIILGEEKRKPGQSCEDDPNACEDLCINTEDGARCQTRCLGNEDNECGDGFACAESLSPEVPEDSLYCQPEDEVACALQGNGREGTPCMCGCDTGLVCEAGVCAKPKQDPDPDVDGEFTFVSPSGGSKVSYGPTPVKLEWRFTGPSPRFDVYLGKSQTQVDALATDTRIEQNITNTTVSVPATSIEAGRYYWKVVARVGDKTFATVPLEFNAQPRPYTGRCPDEPTIQVAGKTYNTAQINNTCWMAQDLTSGTVSTASRFYDDDKLQFSKFGPYYTWWELSGYDTYLATNSERTVNTVTTPCPDGWGIPSYKDWQRLAQTYADAPSRLYSQDMKLSLQRGISTPGVDPKTLESCNTGSGSSRCTRDSMETDAFNVMYWTRTLAEPPSIYAASFDFRKQTGVLSRRSVGASFGLRVRCIRLDGSTD